MIREIVQEADEKMNKTVEVLKKDLASLRAGRATPALLDKIQVDYYGALTPVNQMANINVPEPRLLLIQPWDKSTISAIEKAILKSDLGLTPSNDGNVIRIGIPQLTEERRKELVKVVKKKAEEARVAVRNVRREVNDMIKELEKEHEVSEDDSKRALDEVQKTTDKFIKKVDDTMNAKEKEIMEV
ncbi:ribosome recycling factor [Candidatus Formimonas warabiya]|uniref:Ribosome-recycling factor n=1 Tax=Formimonas warabiya TaxID=1761012 RepID=A0A3G1KQ30_FORW1|nr:ribosome recycling factor [Candidatus Formimonas warabiya]ATW24540.1 ribosome recycling factor [Candidatus Formimonas warabiya]